MTHPDWIDLGPATDFPESSQACVRPNGVPVVLMNVEGTFYALQDRCPHAGRPLGDGERAGLTLTCPHHGYTFNIKNGKNIDDPDFGEPVPTYPVRVESGRVLIQIPPTDPVTSDHE